MGNSKNRIVSPNDDKKLIKDENYEPIPDNKLGELIANKNASSKDISTFLKKLSINQIDQLNEGNKLLLKFAERLQDIDPKNIIEIEEAKKTLALLNSKIDINANIRTTINTKISPKSILDHILTSTKHSPDQKSVIIDIFSSNGLYSSLSLNHHSETKANQSLILEESEPYPSDLITNACKAGRLDTLFLAPYDKDTSNDSAQLNFKEDLSVEQKQYLDIALLQKIKTVQNYKDLSPEHQASKLMAITGLDKFPEKQANMFKNSFKVIFEHTQNSKNPISKLKNTIYELIDTISGGRTALSKKSNMAIKVSDVIDKNPVVFKPNASLNTTGGRSTTTQKSK